MLVEMYISLAGSRAKALRNWSDAQRPERIGDARAGAGEGSVIAAPDLAQGVTTPPELPHRLQLVPGVATL